MARGPGRATPLRKASRAREPKHVPEARFIGDHSITVIGAPALGNNSDNDSRIVAIIDSGPNGSLHAWRNDGSRAERFQWPAKEDQQKPKLNQALDGVPWFQTHSVLLACAVRVQSKVPQRPHDVGLPLHAGPSALSFPPPAEENTDSFLISSRDPHRGHSVPSQSLDRTKTSLSFLQTPQ